MTDVIDLERMRNFGAYEERERITKLIETLPFIWMGDIQLIQTSRDELVKMIRNLPDEQSETSRS
jgi:hypothetical protein